MSRALSSMSNSQPSASGNRPPNGRGSCSPALPPMSQGNCGPPRLQDVMRRGILPNVLPTCDADAIIQSGRMNEMYVPEYVVWHFFAQAITYGPTAPIQTSGTKAAGNLVLTLALAGTDGAGTSALVAGVVISVQTSANVPPGDTYISFAGTFEDGSAYAQSAQWVQGAVGNSRFIQLFSKEVQGGAYPALVSITTVPVNLTATITNAALNTVYSAQTLSPVSDYWYWTMAFWEQSARENRSMGRRFG